MDYDELTDDQTSHLDVNQKVLKYETFVNETLKDDLRYVLESRDALYDTLAEYMKLQSTIERLQTLDEGKLRSQIDVGCNFYMQAEVPDTQYIYIDVGSKLFVQFTLDEGLRFLEKKIKQMTIKSEKMTDKSCDIKARIKLIIEAIAELQGLSGDKVQKPQRQIF